MVLDADRRLRYLFVMTGRRVIAAFTLVATTGCVSLRPVWDPARFIAEIKPPLVYVMKGSVAVLTITNPRVSGDTVHGTLLGESLPVALPLSDVQNIGTVRLSGARTAMLVGSAAAIGALMAYAVLAHGSGAMKVCIDGDTSMIDDWCELNR